MLNNREWASLFWLGLVFSLAMLKRDLRSSVGGVLRIALNPAIVIVLVLFASYVALEVWGASMIGLWRSSLAKETVVWAITSGIVLVFNFQTASRESAFFRRTVATTLSVTVVLEFFLNFFVLSLLAELLLQPIVAFVGMLSIVASRDERHKPVKKLADALSAVFGFTMLGFVLRQIYLHWRALDLDALLEFLLPVWMTVGLLPFVFAVALFAAYDSLWRDINRTTSDRRVRIRTRAAVIMTLHVRLRDANAFRWKWVQDAVAAGSFAAARRVVETFGESRRAQERVAAARAERLRKYAGSNETDEGGRRLDRREFDGTIDAFRLLAAYQAGQYRMLGGQYRPDLLNIVGNDFTRHGLPKDAGITISVAKDGQEWYAWRRTVTGWCFAIGGTAQSPGEWEHDGPEPPRGFPGRHPDWGQRASAGEVNKNWVDEIVV